MATKDDLQRWVEAGLIDSGDAEAIEEFERQRGQPTRIGRGMEATAYLGSSLVLVALGILALEFWDRIEPWGQFALSGIITVVLFVVGILLGRSDEPAVGRARAFAWFLTVGGVALTANVVLRELLELDGQDAFIFVSTASLLAAFTLWWLRSSVLQMVALGVTAWMSVIALVARFESLPDWAFGLSFAGLGTVWLLLTWGGVFAPTRTSYVIGGIGVLMIAFPEATESMPWPLLGLIAGLGLMALSVRLDQNVLLGIGVAGLFVYIPTTMFEWFGETLGVPVALLITGLILLGVVVGTVRLRPGAST
jgi:hypothetical protein